MLHDDEVLVFRVDLVPEVWSAFLTEDQLRDCRERPTEAARRETISCEGALRVILGRVLDQEPRAVRVERAPRGKPYVTGGPGFSLTHAKDLGLIAVACRARVGVDLEHRDHVVDCDAVAEGFFPERERVEILSAPEPRRLDVLLRAFTRFESALKATGDGLTVPARNFEDFIDGMLWQHIDMGSRWIGCVTADRPAWTVRILDASALI